MLQQILSKYASKYGNGNVIENGKQVVDYYEKTNE